MALNYGTSAIPSDQYTILEGGTVSVSVAFDASVGLVGGMDTAEGSASPGTVIEVPSPEDALQEFGQDSELHQQTQLAYQNGASTVFALPVTETQTTENFSSASSGTLSNTPIFDPNVHPEHTVDETNQGVDVNIVYEDTVTTPTSGINLNPITGDFEAANSNTYDIQYTYGDYTSDEIATLLDEEPRILGLCTEAESVMNTADTETQDDATNFQFSHAVAGAAPFTSTSNPNTSGYSDNMDTERLSLVASPRGYVDDAETTEVRTVGAVAGHLAGLALGLSSTNNSLSGLTGLRTDLTYADAGDLIDAQVMPLIDYPPVKIVKDMTTSTTPKFERVYAMQVLDEATTLSHIISQEFIGDQNTVANRAQLRRSHRNAFIGMRDSNPPLLDDFSVNVVEDTSDPNKVNVNVGLDIVDVMDVIDVTITVGDILRRTEVA